MKHLFCILSFLAIQWASANISLPAIFSDHMVLQRNSEVTVWGWGSPGEPVTLTAGWNHAEVSFKIGNTGKWQAVLNTPEAGGPYSIHIKGYNEVLLQDILIGEVWLCSGQSNMEWTAAAGIDNAEIAIKEANHPNIRLFTVPKLSSQTEQDNCQGNWQVCEPNTMKWFSSVGYFFGRKLHEELNMPIGLVNASWGGSYAESWTPKSAFEDDEAMQTALKNIKPIDWAPNDAASLYNAMIYPLTSFNFAGVIWYQGENNTGNPQDYLHVFTRLIETWREAFKTSFPFYFAQIAPYDYGGWDGGVKVRDVQRRALQVPNTGMVMTSDIGNIKDIHPRNKQDVGLRFANIALKKHYKTIDAIVEGPLLKTVSFEKGKAVLTFDNAQGLYAVGKTSLFELAGADGKFYAADFKIKKGQVVVCSKQVKSPTHVRFAWDNMAEANLFNAGRLPMSSFTTEVF